jgi:thiamine biosynthesis lipoprotein
VSRRRTAAAGTALGAAAAGLAILIALGAARAATPERSVRYPFRTMGTMAGVTLVTADSAAGVPAAAAVRATFARVDSLMSNWTTTSEVARVNRELATAAGAAAIHPEVAVVLARSLELARDTDGAFDITVEPLVRLWGFRGGGPRRVPPDSALAAEFAHDGWRKLVWDEGSRTLRASEPGMRVDLGGIAKGYAAAVAADSLRAHGVGNAIVDVSGNMQLMGHPADAGNWRVGIRDPRDRVPYFARLRLADRGISTSAKYEQFVAQDGKTYGHIMDPRTGRPAEGLISVTVVAKDAFTADAWDTPLFVLGPKGARDLARARDEISVVLVAPGSANVDTVWVENALRGAFSLEPGEDARFHVEYF